MTAHALLNGPLLASPPQLKRPQRRAAKDPTVSTKNLEGKLADTCEPMLKELGRVKVGHHAHTVSRNNGLVFR